MLLKILLIHGLNNNPQAFKPLQEALTKLGHDCQLIQLPGHYGDRKVASDLKLAQSSFAKSLSPHTANPYFVIAFSQGALYFQHWLREHPEQKPAGQILLAPALSIRNLRLYEFIAGALPAFLHIPSRTPEALRLYPSLQVTEYRTLFEASRNYSKDFKPFRIPTMILIDPRDELVDAQRLKEEYPKEVVFVDRPYLEGKAPGKYHVVFHPDYFKAAEWNSLVAKISDFISVSKVSTPEGKHYPRSLSEP